MPLKMKETNISTKGNRLKNPNRQEADQWAIDIKTLLQSRKIYFLGLLKLDYYRSRFLGLLNIKINAQCLFKGGIY